MEFEKVLKKRINGMAVRILANIEHTLQSDLSDMSDDETFMLKGSDLNIIRGEILNAAGDTTRSLISLLESPRPGQLSFSRKMIVALNQAEIRFVGDDPVFDADGDFYLMNKIRKDVGAGVVYNNTYTCIGLDDVVNNLIPFLDLAQVAGIKIANNQYRAWRDAVCKMYLGEV